MTFRPATVADLDALVELVRLYYVYDHIPFDGELVRPALGELLAHPELGHAWLAHEGEHVAGYLVATLGFDHECGGRFLLVTDLYVCEPFRRRGIATQLLAQVEAHARSLGIRSVELHVERDNDEARALYAKHGFRAHDRLPLHKPLG